MSINKCKYYKCHDLPDEEFDCTLCYCPFYKICKESEKYPLFGGYILKENGLLACEKCVYFHRKSNVKIYKQMKKENKSDKEIFEFFVKKEENK